jgi:hypothetical protein
VKNILLISLLIWAALIKAQSKAIPSKTQPTATVQGKYSGANTENLVHNLMHDTCLDKKFSVVFYLINDSNFLLSATIASVLAIQSYSLNDIMTNLNRDFKPICVQFEHCKTVIIPNHEANKWQPASVAMQDILRNYYEKNVINIYLPEKIDLPYPDNDEAAYTFPLPPVPIGTFEPLDAIIIAYKKYSLSGALLHVMGHYFGLPHTYFEKNPGSIPNPPPPNNASPPIATLEYVDHANIQNCLDHGDGFCDTEADPYPSTPTPTVYPRGQIANCDDSRGLKDGHGDFYIPPYDNYMSHYECRCKYSAQQYKYMAYMILTRRLYLH